ncbi:hypothetical protein KUM37_04745 [Streptomonospora sp. NEAU-YY374]|nr:hypothetical protein [Streptomonospora nanhaiensis]MBX9387291.1 hypothetical protein [Streptomonospora nanhaiensis]
MAARVRAVPGVVALSAGAFGTTATPGPGGRVEGVAVRAEGVEVGVVVRYGRPIPDIAADVRAAVLAARGGSAGPLDVEVRVADIDLADTGTRG